MTTVIYKSGVLASDTMTSPITMEKPEVSNEMDMKYRPMFESSQFADIENETFIVDRKFIDGSGYTFEGEPIRYIGFAGCLMGIAVLEWHMKQSGVGSELDVHFFSDISSEMIKDVGPFAETHFMVVTDTLACVIYPNGATDTAFRSDERGLVMGSGIKGYYNLKNNDEVVNFITHMEDPSQFFRAEGTIEEIFDKCKRDPATGDHLVYADM